MTDKEITAFNEEEVKKWINDYNNEWSYDGKWIRKTYKTHSWKSTLMVVNAIGHLAELAWHHPDLVVSYAFVEVKLACFLLTEISDNCLDDKLNLMFELRIPMLDSCLEYES